MKRICLFLVFLSVLTGCVTQRRCYTRFPPKTDTIRIETIRDSIVIKDKIIEVEIPGELRVDSIIIPCPPPPDTYIPDTARAETEYARAKAWFDYPNINLKLEQKVSILQIKLDSAIKESYHWKTEYEKIIVIPEPEKYIPKIYKHALNICIFIFAIIFIWIGWKAFKFFKK